MTAVLPEPETVVRQANVVAPNAPATLKFSAETQPGGLCTVLAEQSGYRVGTDGLSIYVCTFGERAVGTINDS